MQDRQEETALALARVIKGQRYRELIRWDKEKRLLLKDFGEFGWASRREKALAAYQTACARVRDLERAAGLRPSARRPQTAPEATRARSWSRFRNRQG